MSYAQLASSFLGGGSGGGGAGSGSDYGDVNSTREQSGGNLENKFGDFIVNTGGGKQSVGRAGDGSNNTLLIVGAAAVLLVVLVALKR